MFIFLSIKWVSICLISLLLCCSPVRIPRASTAVGLRTNVGTTKTGLVRAKTARRKPSKSIQIYTVVRVLFNPHYNQDPSV